MATEAKMYDAMMAYRNSMVRLANEFQRKADDVEEGINNAKNVAEGASLVSRGMAYEMCATRLRVAVQMIDDEYGVEVEGEDDDY